MHKDRAFRTELAERIGLGFELPKGKTEQFQYEIVPRILVVPRFSVAVAAENLSQTVETV